MSGAAVGGRQIPPRSGHHQRQFSSDHFLLDSAGAGAGGGAGGKWLGSSGLNHPYSSSLPPSQQVEYSRAARGVNRGAGGELFLSVESPARALGSWSSSQRRNGDDTVSTGQLSPGILDLHSLDTELLPEIPLPVLYDGVQPLGYAQGRGFDDLDPSFFTSKQMSKADINPLKSFSVDKEKLASAAKIKVVVRKRPLNKKEIAKKEEDIITIERSSNSLTVHETKLKVDLTEYVEKHEFVFDAVLDEDVSNDEVYQETVEPVVPAIFQRTKATCFAYGQTGSGKTYTMQPLPLRASQDILRLMHHTYCNQGFQLFVSFFEIYGGKLFDLLNDRRKLCMREDGKQKVCIVGLQEYRVSNVDAIRELIEKGNATRSTGITGANEESSRSHAILQLAIKKSVDGSESKPPRIVGKLSFIDLAGSERGADTTDNDKQTRIEGAEINKSLLALKECIRALDNDQVHIPFRGSKLTEVLRDSFVGDSRTVMISCISPSSGSCEHTLNTLRYADRVKSLSKGSNPKKDLPSAILRESTALPLSSILQPVSTLEGSNDDSANEKNKFGISKQSRRETSPPFNMDHVPSKREEVHVASLNGEYFKEQRSKGSTTAEEFDLSAMACEQGKTSWRKGKAEIYSVSSLEDRVNRVNTPPQKWKDVADDDEDDELNALLQEEEDLVVAHRKQVEETIDIVREEMNLLVKADEPGSKLDDYISKLNALLSQKAAGIVNLQARLAQFQRHLNEYNVLVSSPGP
ncbi:kinesin-like protein KIN-13B [Phoenix dactylifera]|uniref:Kinesin-like protein n=1 Tax=Phoenix dactylifera TaxID=42345 RepID=A0A8B7C5Z8_PHODC|nr:kinesin-like protein KIN-13B [Phoenix dactylifera]